MLTSQSSDLCALAFKVKHDPARGPLVFTRIFSGTLTQKHTLYNSSKGKKERVNQLLQVSAEDLSTMEHCEPGEVCCLVGLKHTRTGDTLVADGSPLKTHVLPGLTIPPAVYSLSVEPETQSDQASMEEALEIMALEDPSLQVEQNAESGQTLLKGIGELHLEIVLDRLKREFNLELMTGKAYVAYRESIAAQDETLKERHTYDRTIAGKRLFAEIEFEVGAPGTMDDPVLTIPKELKQTLTNDEVNSLNESFAAATSRGPRGYPVVGLNLTIRSIAKDTDTTPGAMRACVAMYVAKLLSGESKALMEPLMSVELEVPEKNVGDLLSDVTVKRRGQVLEVDAASSAVGSKHVIKAMIPLAAMMGYATTLRSMTAGEGSFTSEYHSHVPVDAETEFGV